MQWFENWFDTHYYKILYQHRNDEEAQLFILNLFKFIPLNSEDWILDLACGRGRHAKFIHQLGYKVLGIDLSKESILEAKKFENPHLQFEVQDMRYFQLPIQFQLIMSLFTSFGYFENDDDNLHVLKKVYEHLLPKGYFILDFFHSEWVLKHLVPHETKLLNNIYFEIHKYVENQKIVKKIFIADGNQEFTFYEKVNLFTPKDLQNRLEKTGFKIINQFGNYELQSINPESTRVIFLSQKA